MLLNKTRQGWYIKLDDLVITRIDIDFRVGFLLSNGIQTVTLCLETPFVHRQNNVKHVIIPGTMGTLGPILHMFNCGVERIEATEAGHLSMQLTDGTAVETAPDDSYEAWQLSGLGEFLLVCQPQGSVVYFEQQSDSRTGA